VQQLILLSNPLETELPTHQQKYLSHLPPLDPALIASHTPDAHWLLVRDRSHIAGRCSLWWRQTPAYQNFQLGLIGHYAVADADAAACLLEHASQELAGRGCTLAVGPMDGSTWRRYRLLTERGKHPVFFLEPDNPDDWPEHFLKAGFTPLAHYSSALNTDLSHTDPRLERVSQRLQAAGIQIRPVDWQRLDEELHRIYTVATISFRHNFLYTPVSFPEFLNQYRPLLPYLRPELILIAEHSGEPAGFLFAIPDCLEAHRGENVKTVIIKTVAVLPHRTYAGLGNMLVARCHEIARQLGYSQAIHALMRDKSASRHLSRRYAHTIRGYTLFAKQLF
jgi:GNAT superfamily N-acetyltransferase